MPGIVLGLRVGRTTQGGSALIMSALNGGIYRLAVSNSTGDVTNDIDIGVGEVVINSFIIENTGTFTKRLDAAWAAGTGNGGLFSGTKANSTTYHVFAMRNTSTGAIDFGFDTSATGANKPSGWDVVRIWSVITNSSGAIRPFTQFGDYCEWVDPVLDVNAAIGTSGTLYALTVPTGISVQPDSTVYSAGSTDFIYISSPTQTNSAASATGGLINAQGTSGQNTVIPQRYTNTSGQVRFRGAVGSGTTTRVLTYGYTDFSRGQ